MASSELERLKTELSTLRLSLQTTISEKERLESGFANMETQWEAELTAEKKLTEAYKTGTLMMADLGLLFDLRNSVVSAGIWFKYSL